LKPTIATTRAADARWMSSSHSSSVEASGFST
jgi:hypothetical protein